MASLFFDSRTTLYIALGIVALIAAILAFRRRLNSIPPWLLMIGATLLAVAAGVPQIDWRKAESVIVRVDLSPSTRTAAYRSRDYLIRRVAELLGNTPYRIEYFANGVVAPPTDAPTLADSPCGQTIYPASDAVTLLFSDCRFELPLNAPATYVALDSALEDPVDGAITGIDPALSRVHIAVRVVGPPRTLTVAGATPTTQIAEPGEISHAIDVPKSTATITAQLNPADAWPENDVLSTAVAPQNTSEKWWVGTVPAPHGWKQLSPTDLPLSPETYLTPSIVALSNIQAAELDATRQQRLTQYVKDLGGSLLILGGNHAFGAGAYYGTELDALSPLASNPPTPSMQWIILVDASGSMSSPAAGSTRWALATSAAVSLLSRIPPTDAVSMGGFSDAISWWAQSQPAKDLVTVPLPPAQAVPHGPTNLQPAIQTVIDSLPGKSPAHLLIISDFDATITEADRLATALRAKQIHLDLLAIGRGGALPALREMSTQTGGNTLVSSDPAQWSQSARDLLATAIPDHFETQPVSVVFTEPALTTAPETITAWNRVWAKPAANILAQATLADSTFPMAAEWNIGSGRVLAVPFTPRPMLIDSITQHLATAPRDPRISISHQAARELIVTIRAIDGSIFLNDLHPTLELHDASDSTPAAVSHPIPQTAPGTYELRLPAPQTSHFANVIVNDRSVDRFAVAGRYAPEFDAIGNDRVAMDTLASRTGGTVIVPTQTNPINIAWPHQRAPITAPLAFAGAAVIGIALIWMRRTGAA